MASPARWTWVWVNSGSWWWTGRPGVLWFMGSKESDTTEQLNWTVLNCSLEENYDQPRQHIKKQKHTLPTKVHLVKAMVILLVRYRCESWTIKKAEHWRIDAFELWCWRRLLRVPWTARTAVHPKGISPEYSLEGLILKLKLQYFGHLMCRVDSLEKILTLGGTGGRRRRGQQMAGWHHQLDGHEFEWTPGVGDGQGGLVCCDSQGCKESDTTEWLNWTEELRFL